MGKANQLPLHSSVRWEQDEQAKEATEKQLCTAKKKKKKKGTAASSAHILPFKPVQILESIDVYDTVISIY